MYLINIQYTLLIRQNLKVILQESQAVENEAQLEVNLNLRCPLFSDLKKCHKSESAREHFVQAFLLKHGENMVDCLGAEVDRIEKNLKQKHPEVFFFIYVFSMLEL